MIAVNQNKGFVKLGFHRAFVVLAFLVSLLTSQSLSAQSLDEIAQLARGGAPGLALNLLDQHQPDAEQQALNWFEWERQRVVIIKAWQQWDLGIQRFENLPVSLPDNLQRWGKNQLVWFYLEHGDGAKARGLLRDLLWLSNDPGEQELKLWRRLLVRSYLIDGLSADAMLAMQRYQQDYQDPDPEWRILQLRVLLTAGQSAGAEQLAQGLEGEPVQALRLLARLQNNKPAADIFKLARDQALASTTSARGRALFWSVAAQAGRQMASSPSYALAFDQGVRYAQHLTRDDELFRFDADALWRAYREFGEWSGNDAKLLLGQDEPWFTAAEAAMQQAPVRARALLVVMTEKASTADDQLRAHTRLAESLLAESDGLPVLQLLYLHAPRYQDVGNLPLPVRYLLIDQALNAADIATASRLFVGLEQPPAGVDVFSWHLRRARVLVMGGQADEGVQVLNSLFVPEMQLNEEQFDRFLQVIFDLQAAEIHEPALALLERVHGFAATPQRQREWWFWRADSLKALHRYSEAGYAYLRSATLFDANAQDPWSQTARYSAAEVLAKAGLVSDAAHIYEFLLRITSEPARAAVLRNQMQRLGLQSRVANDIDH